MLVGFDRGPIFDGFSIGKQVANNQKNRYSDAIKTSTSDFVGGVGGRDGVPEELLESAKSVKSFRVCKNVWDALSAASRGRRIYGLPPLPPTSKQKQIKIDISSYKLINVYIYIYMYFFFKSHTFSYLSYIQRSCQAVQQVLVDAVHGGWRLCGVDEVFTWSLRR